MTATLPGSLRAAARRRHTAAHHHYDTAHVIRRARARPRGVSYERSSNPRAGLDGTSIAGQHLGLRRLCSRLKLDLVGRFRETVSGTRRDRAAFTALLERLEEGDIDVVVVWEESRLSRGDLVGEAQLIAVCEALGVRIVTNTGAEYNLHKSEDKRRLRYRLLEAGGERDNIMERVRRGQQDGHAEGYFVAGSAPVGYNARGPRRRKTLVPNRDAKVIQEIYRRYAAGVTANAIAKALNEDPSMRRPGKKRWTPVGVGYVLENPTYAGYLWFARDLVQGRHKPLVGLRLWERVQELRARGRARHPGRPKKKAAGPGGDRPLTACKQHGDAFAVDLGDGLIVCRPCAKGTYLGQRLP